MTRRPFDPGEAGDLGPDMDPTLADLERYLADTADHPSTSFADHVMAVLEHEPTPRRGLLGALLASISAPAGTGRLALLAATAAVAILAVVAFGQLSRLLPPPNLGSSPTPSIASPSPEPSPSLGPSVEPSPTPTPRATRSQRPTASPDGSDDGSDASDSPDPSDDHSGPGGGGGGDDNSGPGSSSSPSDDSSGHGKD